MCDNIRVGEMQLEVTATWGTMSGIMKVQRKPFLSFKQTQTIQIVWLPLDVSDLWNLDQNLLPHNI